MEAALLQAQTPELALPTVSLSHSRRARRTHRVVGQWGFLGLYESFLRVGQAAGLGRPQMPSQTLRANDLPLSKLEQLKVRRFSTIGREDRIARSLAALREELPFQLTAADWQWLDEHSDIEDDFE